MSSAFSVLLHRVQHGISPLEIMYAPHTRWPLSRRSSPLAKTLRISVLDSSFNPPTLAHLALATIPPPSLSTPTQSDIYDATLLLLSVRNADKTLKPSDATHAQRLDMIIRVARDLPAHANAAVAIIAEPTFVAKSSVLLASLRNRLVALSADSESAIRISDVGVSSSEIPRPQFTWLLGMDTLERLFAPRYYSSEEAMRVSLRRFLSAEGDDASIVCARRAIQSSTAAQVHNADENDLKVAHEFMQSGRIILIDIGERERTFSSSEVRALISSGDVNWKGMVPSSVVEYVEEQKLYTNV